MANPNNALIGHASPHTIKKFELVEAYITTWAQKLLQNPSCKSIVFIDCMCNSGQYYDDNENIVYGTPIRIAKILRDAAGQYPAKKVYVYLNDLSAEKIDLLRQALPKESRNFKYSITSQDANDLLKRIGPKLHLQNQLHYFLFYDPFDASIDWDALTPFFRSWGEILINHMVNDSIRAITQVKRETTKKKYEGTYRTSFERLLPYGSEREAYERRVEEIILTLRGNYRREYYVASFPFFNSRNSLVYDLIHCTSNEKGFKLFKSTAWKTFGGKSSLKDTHGSENQLVLDFNGGGKITTQVDKTCYNVMDIVDFIHKQYQGRQDVPFSEVWALLDKHPVFPADGYRSEIKAGLRDYYGDKISRSTITFIDGGARA